jgi:uncharacterized protein
MGFFDSIRKTKMAKLLNEGKEALERRDGPRALQSFSHLAEAGDAEGQCRLASLYKSGLFDFEKAAFWYRRAAEQGHPEAQCKLGFLYRSGRGVAKDDAEGARWYEKAAAQGYVEAQLNLGRCYLYGEGVARSAQDAIKWLTRAAKGGEDAAAYLLGCVLVEGKLVPQDISMGLHWLERVGDHATTEAVTIGDLVAPAADDLNRNSGVNALYTLGQIYRQGKLVGGDLRRAFGYYLRAAKLGDSESQFAAGMMLFEGVGTQKDVREAARWLLTAAQQGHEGAKHNFGIHPEFAEVMS